MASFTTISIRGEYRLGLTIDDSVGIGGANIREDVELIQAMLGYIIPMGLWNWTDSPIPPKPAISGLLDGATTGAIIHYQFSRSWRLMKSFDGIVHAPSYGRSAKSGRETTWIPRDLKNLDNPLMMMTLMHFEAKKLATHRYPHGGSYITGMKMMYPQVISKLKGQELMRMSWVKQ